MTPRGATISNDELYRWHLWRMWTEDAPQVLFVMLNPSTADGLSDDPTIRRCEGFARRWGMGGFQVVNVFPWRATDPRALVAADKAGLDVRRRDERNHHVRVAIQRCHLVIAAWGGHRLAREEWKTLPITPGDLHDLAKPPLQCIGMSKLPPYAPKHPLYLRKNTPLQVWSPNGPKE